jgi:hypothetical protein
MDTEMDTEWRGRETRAKCDDSFQPFFSEHTYRNPPAGEL